MIEQQTVNSKLKTYLDINGYSIIMTTVFDIMMQMTNQCAKLEEIHIQKKLLMNTR